MIDEDGERTAEFEDPLRRIVSHLGNALVNALSEGERDDGLILRELEVASESCAGLMDDSDAFMSVYAAYEFLGGDVSQLPGVRDRGEAEAEQLTEEVVSRAEDMPI